MKDSKIINRIVIRYRVVDVDVSKSSMVKKKSHRTTMKIYIVKRQILQFQTGANDSERALKIV